MTSWLAILGWLLLASALGPALMLACLGIVAGFQWAAVSIYEAWLRRCARRFEDVSVAAMAAELREKIANDPELQTLVLIDELEQFLREGLP